LLWVSNDYVLDLEGNRGGENVGESMGHVVLYENPKRLRGIYEPDGQLLWRERRNRSHSRVPLNHFRGGIVCYLSGVEKWVP